MTGRTPGTGLGLAGVRQIVELHGGSITAEREETIGSTFTLRLPVGVSPEKGPVARGQRAIGAPGRGLARLALTQRRCQMDSMPRTLKRRRPADMAILFLDVVCWTGTGARPWSCS